MTNDEFSTEDLRFLHHQMRLRRMRERNRRRSTALVISGLLVMTLACFWAAVR